MAKRPLPSLRFVIYISRDEVYRFIPQTTKKGIVVHDVWALPGREMMTTSQLVELCKQKRYRYEITGDSGVRRRQ